MDRSKTGRKEKKKSRRPKLQFGRTIFAASQRPEAVDELPNQPTPIIRLLPLGEHDIVVFYKKWKKQNGIQLTKKQNGQSKNKNNPPSSDKHYEFEICNK